MRHAEPAHFTAHMTAAIYQPARHDTIRKDTLIMINIFEEEIKSRNTLGQALLNRFPFLSSDDTWQKIIGPYTFCSFTTSINSECDALIHKRHICCLLALLERLQRHFEQTIVKL